MAKPKIIIQIHYGRVSCLISNDHHMDITVINWDLLSVEKNAFALPVENKNNFQELIETARKKMGVSDTSSNEQVGDIYELDGDI